MHHAAKQYAWRGLQCQSVRTVGVARDEKQASAGATAATAVTAGRIRIYRRDLELAVLKRVVVDAVHFALYIPVAQ